jgi:NADH dehydrogenase (ubiquinone) 1 beta subcomplex subunit 3
MFTNLFPGLGIAIVAFSAYVLADNLYLSKRKEEISHH